MQQFFATEAAFRAVLLLFNLLSEFQRTFRDKYAHSLFLMQGLVVCVLLLCCVNISGLMMAEIQARRHEFALGTALGAAKWRLMRQYFTESLAIAAAGGLLGAAMAWYGNRFLLDFFRDPMQREALSVHPDSTVWLATCEFTALATLLFGTLPGWRAGRSDPGTLLKSRTSLGTRRNSAGS